MLVTATVTFSDVILAIHILAVIACFGVIVAYPLIFSAAERFDKRSVPVLHRVRVVIGRSLVNPGLVVVLAAGIYLAAHLSAFNEFYVQFGIGAVVVLGALEGGYTIRSSKHLAELAAADVESAGGGEVQWSAEYISRKSRSDFVGGLMALIVLVTAFLMTVH